MLGTLDQTFPEIRRWHEELVNLIFPYSNEPSTKRLMTDAISLNLPPDAP